MTRVLKVWQERGQKKELVKSTRSASIFFAGALGLMKESTGSMKVTSSSIPEQHGGFKANHPPKQHLRITQNALGGPDLPKTT